MEVTRRGHEGDPRADVELLEGVFPGCCHAGVGDALWVPRFGEAGRFSPALTRAVEEARGPRQVSERPGDYLVRERQTGRTARGVACMHLGPTGCCLGDLKAPLCLVYLCDPVRAAVARAVGWERVGPDSDDFGGSLAALGAVVAGPIREAEERVRALEASLAELHRTMEAAGLRAGEDLYRVWEREIV
jgi:hypothetical protein